MLLIPAPVDDVIAQVPAWTGRNVSHTLVKGGLSHCIAQVNVDDHVYILRVLDSEVTRVGLGIPLSQEIENTTRAAETRVGARVIEVLPHVPALVLEFIDGPTLSLDDVRRSENVPRVAEACRSLHAAPRAFANEFNIFRKREELVEVCRRNDLQLPEGYEEYRPLIRDVEETLAKHPLPLVPCHNDLLAENFMDDGVALRIVDYQLSGMNEPTFDLGDVAAESDFDPDQVGRLTQAYFGAETSQALLARVRLALMMTNYTWTLWFVIHQGLLSGPNVDFDYWAEANDKWGQAIRDLESPEFGTLLDAAGRAR